MHNSSVLRIRRLGYIGFGEWKPQQGQWAESVLGTVFTMTSINYPISIIHKNSSGDEIANVNFFTTTSYM